MNDLPTKMITISDRDSLPIDHPMRILAQELSIIVINKDSDIKKLVGAWARARKCYCDYTGEPLI